MILFLSFPVSPIGPVKRKSWSTPERKKVLDLFGSNIETGELPTLPECSTAINSYQVLQDRSPAQLKAWVHNEIKKKSKGFKCTNRRGNNQNKLISIILSLLSIFMGIHISALSTLINFIDFIVSKWAQNSIIRNRLH